jgi:hypothetical protein
VERCPSWASSIIPHVPNKPNQAATCPGNRPASLVASCPSWSTSICQGLIPISQIYAKNVLMRAFFSSLCMGSSQTLSCICHPNVHLMGSSAPWRSELIISPCAPILWYLSAGHGPAHQKLRPPGAHQSKTSWQCESNFIIKLSNACMTPLTDLLIAQRPYTDPPYKVKATKGQPIGSIPTRTGKFPQRVIQNMYSDVIWF